MENKSDKYRILNSLNLIKIDFFSGKITYDEAALKAKPLIDEMNEKAKLIAKRHNKKFKPIINFSGFMRG